MTYKAPVAKLSCAAKLCFQAVHPPLSALTFHCIVTHPAPLYSNLPPASLASSSSGGNWKLGQHWLDDEAGRQPHRLAVPLG